MPGPDRHHDSDTPRPRSPRLFGDIDRLQARPVEPIVFCPRLSDAQRRRIRQMLAVKSMRESDPAMSYRMIAVTIGISRRHVIRIWKSIEAKKMRQARV